MGNSSKNQLPGGRSRQVPVLSDLAVASALSAPAMLAACVALLGKGEVLLSFDQLAYIADHVDMVLTHLPTGRGVKLTTHLRPGAHVVEAPSSPLAEEPLEPCRGGDPTCPCQDGDVCHYVDDPVTGTPALQPPDIPPGLTQSDMLELDPPPDEPSVN